MKKGVKATVAYAAVIKEVIGCSECPFHTYQPWEGDSESICAKLGKSLGKGKLSDQYGHIRPKWCPLPTSTLDL